MRSITATDAKAKEMSAHSQSAAKISSRSQVVSTLESAMPFGITLRLEHHSGGDHRSGKRAAAGLVHPGDAGETGADQPALVPVVGDDFWLVDRFGEGHNAR